MDQSNETRHHPDMNNKIYSATIRLILSDIDCDIQSAKTAFIITMNTMCSIQDEAGKNKKNKRLSEVKRLLPIDHWVCNMYYKAD